MRTQAFGLGIDFEQAPPGAWLPAAGALGALAVRDVDPAAVEAAWSGLEAVGWEATVDGRPFCAERGVAGDHRFRHGAGSVHHLDAGGSLLLRAVAEYGVAGWRATLDSVLFSAALLAGFEALHAGAVADGGCAVAIAAASGGGKSTLLAELLGGGDLALHADDVVILEAGGEGPPLAHPGPPLMTVPASLGAPPGEGVCAVGDELWRAVAVSGGALPLGALVLLDRRPGEATAMHRVEQPLALLLGSLLRFPRDPLREAARFDMAASIAATVPIWRLAADPAVDPATLAATLRARIPLGV